MENMEEFENRNMSEAASQTINEQPVDETPVNEQPVNEEPINDQPVRQPVYQQPVYQQPVYQQYAQPGSTQNAVTPKEKKNGKKAGTVVGLIVGAIALVLVTCVLTTMAISGIWERKYDVLNQAMGNRLNVMQEQLDEALANQSGGGASQEPVTGEMLPAQVYSDTVDTVVAITSTVTSNYFGQVTEGVSTGSGVVLSADGYIATNYHVVEGGTELTVTTHSGEEYTAQLVGYDSTNDIAVLKVDATDLVYAPIGSSDTLNVGDKVAAIGNPLGELTATMTVGYISAKDRMVATDGTSINMLQTDAAINSGNSGGPLFNMYGEVVGITTAKYSGTSNSGATIEGIGFAIPIDDVVDIIDDLINYGYVTGAYLGVMVRDLDSAVAATYGLPLGVRVEEVTPGYCAEAAGIQVGDIIINLGGYEVTNMSTLSRALRKFEAGEQTTITVFRSGAEVHMSIVLSEKPVETETQVPETQPQTQETMPQYGYDDDWIDRFFDWGW